MLNLIASIVFSLNINAAPVAPKCETYAPNVAGVSVTVCGGEVTKRCDQAGNCLFSAETY